MSAAEVKRKWAGSLGAWGALGVVVAGIVFFAANRKPPEKAAREEEKPMAVRTIELEPRQVDDHVLLPARIEPLQEANLGAERAGRVVEIIADKGQEVEAGQVFHINRTEVLPLRVMHGRLPILGYRIGGRLGYITDMHMMPEESYEQLKGLDVLVMNALRPKPHPTHQSISEALEAAGRIGAKETYFIHMSHHAGLHADIEKLLPPHVHFAYDGLEIDF